MASSARINNIRHSGYNSHPAAARFTRIPLSLTLQPSAPRPSKSRGRPTKCGGAPGTRSVTLNNRADPNRIRLSTREDRAPSDCRGWFERRDAPKPLHTTCGTQRRPARIRAAGYGESGRALRETTRNEPGFSFPKRVAPADQRCFQYTRGHRHE